MVRRKNGRKRFPLSSAGSQGEGDRGRWNYPSQATAAFEMVLSPGAGIASAAGKSALHASAGYSRGRLCKCRKRFSAGVPGAVAPGKINLESPPSPEGKSALRARVGGMGAEKQTKGRADRRQRRHATRRARGLPPFPVPPGFSRRAPVWQGLYVPQAV